MWHVKDTATWSTFNTILHAPYIEECIEYGIVP
jgi:hypothetical protein